MIKNNKFRHGGGALDAVISLNPTTLGDAYAVDGLEILGNEMIVGASGHPGEDFGCRCVAIALIS